MIVGLQQQLQWQPSFSMLLFLVLEGPQVLVVLLLLQAVLHQGQQAVSSVALTELPQGTGTAPVNVVDLVVPQGAVVLEGVVSLLRPLHLVLGALIFWLSPLTCDR